MTGGRQPVGDVRGEPVEEEGEGAREGLRLTGRQGESSWRRGQAWPARGRREDADRAVEVVGLAARSMGEAEGGEAGGEARKKEMGRRRSRPVGGGEPVEGGGAVEAGAAVARRCGDRARSVSRKDAGRGRPRERGKGEEKKYRKKREKEGKGGKRKE